MRDAGGRPNAENAENAKDAELRLLRGGIPPDELGAAVEDVLHEAGDGVGEGEVAGLGRAGGGGVLQHPGEEGLPFALGHDDGEFLVLREVVRMEGAFGPGELGEPALLRQQQLSVASGRFR